MLLSWLEMKWLSQLFGWPMYLIRNAASQRRYPSGTNRSWNNDLLI